MDTPNEETKQFPAGTIIEKRESIWITREVQANDSQLPALLLNGWEPYAGAAVAGPHPVNPQLSSVMPIVFLRTQEDVTVALLPNGDIEVIPPNVTPVVTKDIEDLMQSVTWDPTE
jgi:hypothetical protein